VFADQIEVAAMTLRSRAMRAAGAVSLLVLVACTGAHPADRELPASSPPADGPTTASDDHHLATRLQGTWLVQRSRAQMRADMAAFGFGRYANALFHAEELGRRVTLAVTYTDDSFSIAWQRHDHTWYVGWYGTAHTDHGVLTVTDALSHADDSYTWRVAASRLTLRFRRTTTPDQHGIPFEAYSRAYFTRPLQAVDCTPNDLDACLRSADGGP
jgi:hypothetical protein